MIFGYIHLETYFYRSHTYVKTDFDWQELNYGYRNGFGKGGLREDLSSNNG